MDTIFLNILNGLSYGMVLFLIAAGLSLVLGVMGIVNLAHGSLFVAGGFIGVAAAYATNSFVLGIFAGAAGSGVIGFVLQRGFLQRLYKQDYQQILLTFGVVYIIADLLSWIWGASPRSAFIPDYFSGKVAIGEYTLPVYRLAIIAIGAVFCAVLWWLQDKTRIGAIVRAGMDDAEMVSGLGINLKPINTGIFVFSSAIAGAGAVIGIQLFGSLAFNDGLDMLLVAIAVVIIGGIGSVQGALVGAIIIGLVDTFGRVYFPQFAQYTIYAAMIIILMVKPTGLFGREA